jgi:hypothetical protein
MVLSAAEVHRLPAKETTFAITTEPWILGLLTGTVLLTVFPKLSCSGRPYLIFLFAARLIIFAEFVFVMRQWVSRRLKGYVPEMYGIGRDLYDFL